MDDELQQLEAELKSLRPAPVPRRLVVRLERELAPVASARRTAAPLVWFWAALPAAAALVVALGVMKSRDAVRPVAPGTIATSPSGAVLKPVAAENVLYAATDEGIVTLDDGTRAHRERLNYVDTITWKNPRTNASLTWSVPREEVRLVPISYQ